MEEEHEALKLFKSLRISEELLKPCDNLDWKYPTKIEAEALLRADEVESEMVVDEVGGNKKACKWFHKNIASMSNCASMNEDQKRFVNHFNKAVLSEIERRKAHSHPSIFLHIFIDHNVFIYSLSYDCSSVSGVLRELRPPFEIPIENCDLVKNIVLWNGNRQSRRYTFESNVKSVRCLRGIHDMVIATFFRKVNIFNLEDLNIIRCYDTASNPKGLCEVSFDEQARVIATLGARRGEVYILDYVVKSFTRIAVNKSRICFLSLSHDGTFLVTLCHGCLFVDVFRAREGINVCKVRWDNTLGSLSNFAIFPTAKYMGAISEKHLFIFDLTQDLNHFTAHYMPARSLRRKKAVLQVDLPCGDVRSFVICEEEPKVIIGMGGNMMYNLDWKGDNTWMLVQKDINDEMDIG